jgi:NADP-dependent 3-hydroxy acid dehydrogenase YdfG
MMNEKSGTSARFARIAIITGATSGIGEAAAKSFVASGYGVVGNARNAEKLRALEQKMGDAFIGIAGDASDGKLPARLFAAATGHFGKAVDIIVVNAGRGLGGSVKDADLSKFEDVLRLNVTGALALLQHAARNMADEQPSNYPEQAKDIVIIGSVVGRHISPFSGVYGATKFAVHALAEGLRRELGPRGIRVSLVEPGVVVSGFQDGAGYSDDMVRNFDEKFGPLLYGDDVANAIHYIVTRPPHVHISDIMVRPTRQDYP